MEEIDDQTRWLSEQAPRLILFARQWVSCHADAEDVFHTAFVRFWRQRGCVRDPIPFLYTCVRRAAVNWRREQSRREKRERAVNPQPLFATDQDQLAKAETDEAIEGALLRLGVELSRRSLKQSVAEVKVIVVATALSFALAPPNRPGDVPEYLISFRVTRVLKGKLTDKVISIRTPTDPKEFIGRAWVVMLSPEYVSRKHKYAGLYHIMFEPQVKAILSVGGPGGSWPKSWPKELEPLRKQTMRWGWVEDGYKYHNKYHLSPLRLPKDVLDELERVRSNLAPNNVPPITHHRSGFDIPFANREEFESAWPHILELKSKGAPVTLLHGPHKKWFLKHKGPVNAGVRILAPHTGILIAPGGGTYPSGVPVPKNVLRIGPPWPDDIKSESGVLPPYVFNDNGKWSTVRDSFVMRRARLEIELIIDGDIVDLNRIRLPADTPIIDKRFKD